MKTCNLRLHAGAHQVDRRDLLAVNTPEKTATWCPIPHEALIGHVQRTMEAGGLKVITEAHALTRGGLRYFGLMQVSNGDDNDQFGLVVGLRNSHDKSFPSALCLGSSVFVCDNLAFSGEVRLSRKHTVHIERDLPGLVVKAVGLLGDLRKKQDERLTKYRLVECSNMQAHDLMIRSIDERVLPPSMLPALVKEWREPRHPEFKDRTLWSLFNAYTEVLKGSLQMLPNRTHKLHGMLDLVVDGTPLQIPDVSAQDAEIQVGQAV